MSDNAAKISDVISLLRAMPEFHQYAYQGGSSDISKISAALALALEGTDWPALRTALTGGDLLDLNALLTLPPVTWGYPGESSTIPKFPASFKIMVRLPRFEGDPCRVVNWSNDDHSSISSLAWALTELPKHLPQLKNPEDCLLLFLAVGMVPLSPESWWAPGVQRERFEVTKYAKSGRSWLESPTRISWKSAGFGSPSWDGIDVVSETSVATVARESGYWSARWRDPKDYQREQFQGDFNSYLSAQEWVNAIYEGREPDAGALNTPEEPLLPVDVKRVGDNLYETPDGRYVVRRYPESGWTARSQHLFELGADRLEGYQVARAASMSQLRKNLAQYLRDWERGKLGHRGRYGWDGDTRPVAAVPKQERYFTHHGDVADVRNEPPAQMTPKEVNSELDYLEEQSRRVVDRMILLGRGYETPREREKKTDPLSILDVRLSQRMHELQREIYYRTVPLGTPDAYAHPPKRMPEKAKAREVKSAEKIVTTFYKVGATVNMAELESARQATFAGRAEVDTVEVTTYFTEGWPKETVKRGFGELWRIGNLFARMYPREEIHISDTGQPWVSYQADLYLFSVNQFLSQDNAPDWLLDSRIETSYSGVVCRQPLTGYTLKLTPAYPVREYMAPVKPTELSGAGAEKYLGYMIERGYLQVDTSLSVKEWKLLMQYPTYDAFVAAYEEWSPKVTREDPYALINVYHRTFLNDVLPEGVVQMTKGMYGKRSIKFVVPRSA